MCPLRRDAIVALIVLRSIRFRCGQRVSCGRKAISRLRCRDKISGAADEAIETVMIFRKLELGARVYRCCNENLGKLPSECWPA